MLLCVLWPISAKIQHRASPVETLCPQFQPAANICRPRGGCLGNKQLHRKLAPARERGSIRRQWFQVIAHPGKQKLRTPKKRAYLQSNILGPSAQYTDFPRASPSTVKNHTRSIPPAAAADELLPPPGASHVFGETRQRQSSPGWRIRPLPQTPSPQRRGCFRGFTNDEPALRGRGRTPKFFWRTPTTSRPAIPAQRQPHRERSQQRAQRGEEHADLARLRLQLHVGGQVEEHVKQLLGVFGLVVFAAR